ncbi:hypothetical protein BK138_32890 [Paenibacillus rhizosphaerae]|uniref:Uncharacterized protein n=1 Tax=Paenibacillus rhizosphaerae TaxID=297318 RepID=A0A1R1E580_9BACL|nr:hypothetical protein [Paenibacillus rhizosphaerae]OMF46892.1 hypothetical protein BK138_32890 [Paenibacillus rhizosphaerae]
MGLKVSINRDYFNIMADNAVQLIKELPEPLPWVEPSINMLYLNAASSLVMGNFYGSIICSSTLLEHTLRLAVLNPDSNGLKRQLSKSKLDKYQSISALLKAPNISNIIPNQDDIDWWENVASKLRNKSAHYLIPTLLKLFTGKDYAPENYVLTNDDGTPQHDLLHDWGSFFHKTDYHIAIRFFKESTDQLQKIINNTQWESDLSWWESQADHYNMFFEYQWTIDNMKNSLNIMYKDLFQRSEKKSEDCSEEEGHIR